MSLEKGCREQKHLHFLRCAHSKLLVAYVDTTKCYEIKLDPINYAHPCKKVSDSEKLSATLERFPVLDSKCNYDIRRTNLPHAYKSSPIPMSYSATGLCDLSIFVCSA
jgi:hypothetical protein